MAPNRHIIVIIPGVTRMRGASLARGILSLEEFAGQKTTLDEEFGEFSRDLTVLMPESEVRHLPAERVDIIETLTTQMRSRLGSVDDKQA